MTAEDLTWGSWRLARLEWVFPLHWTRTRLRFLEAGRFEGFGGMAEFSGSYQLGPDGQLTFERLDSELTPLNVNVAVPTSLYEPSLDNQVGSRFGGTPIAQQERLEVLLSRVDRGELRGPRLLLFERDQVILEFSPLEPQPGPREDPHANSESIPTEGDSASGN
ncbi:MAG: META domain-containing protein [Planctomycetota bacterium]